ncbi:MAG: spermine/spermidine synthase domain-containing protein [Planctomycetota bacterium]
MSTPREPAEDSESDSFPFSEGDSPIFAPRKSGQSPRWPRSDFPADLAGRARTVLFLAVCCLGISAFTTQLTLMRELLSVFSGNELVFGIVLGNWLLLTGIGSALGKTASRLNSPVTVLVVAQILVAVLPIAEVFLLRTLRNVVFMRGVEVGVTGAVVSSFVLLAPYCLIAGYLLTLACLVLASRKDPSSIGQVYFLDNIGDMVGGLLFSFVLIWLFDHFGILYFPAILNLALAGWVAVLFRRPIVLAAAAAVAAILVALTATHDLDDLSAKVQYYAIGPEDDSRLLRLLRRLWPESALAAAEQRLVYNENSPYGRLIVTKLGGQYNFIENGVPLFSTENLEDREETVHYAMAQRPDARRVLLISGGVSGTAREILKYGNVAAVDYVELDPKILDVARQYVPEALEDPRIHVFNTDGRLFVKQAGVRQAGRRYDVAIVDVPDPSTFQINRFYTREFFREVRRVLWSDGVLAFSLGRYADFVGPELADLIAAADRTLSDVYKNVLVIPGEDIFFLASDGELTLEMARQIERAGVETRLVNRDYLKVILGEGRLANIRRALSDEAPVNKDFSPILYYYNLRLWMTKHRVHFGLLEAGLLLLLLVYLLRIRPVTLAIFTTGFAASALEIVLLVGFQILYGCVYHQVGLIVTMFMLGLGIGSFTMNRMLRRRTRKDLAKLELAIAAYAVCLPLLLVALGGLGGWAAAVASRVVIPLAALLLAVLVGLEFPLAGKAVLAAAKPPAAEKTGLQAVTSTAAGLYTADYVGAALGALLVSTLLIPLIGVLAVCLLAAGLNLASGVVILLTSRN